MKQIEFFIHPGYGKTGTTFLQEKIFSKIGFINLGKVFSDNELKGLQYNVFRPKYTFDPIYPFNLQDDLKKYIFKIQEIIESSNNKRVILSDEVIFDRINYFGDYNIYLFKEIIDKLSEKFIVNLNFILTIRNQSDLIAPTFAYNYYRQKQNFGNLNNYINKILTDKNLSQIYFYDELVVKIKKTFSPKKIIILPYEELSTDYENYLKKIEEFMEISLDELRTKNEIINKNHINIDGSKSWYLNDLKISKFYIYLTKIHNILKENKFYKNHHSKLNFIKKIFLPKQKKVGLISISEHQKNLLKKHYIESNQKLEKLCQIDLKRFGYH